MIDYSCGQCPYTDKHIAHAPSNCITNTHAGNPMGKEKWIGFARKIICRFIHACMFVHIHVNILASIPIDSSYKFLVVLVKIFVYEHEYEIFYKHMRPN